MKLYKVTGYFDGVVYAQYKGGMIAMLLCELTKPLINNTNPPGWDMFPMRENDLLNCTEMFTVVELKPKSVADKVAMFCMVYHNIKGVPYRAGKEEKANLKLVTVNEPLLKTYFMHTAFPLSVNKTMTDYVKHYNFVRDINKNGNQVVDPNKMPNDYDAEYEKTLTGEQLSKYWTKLIANGWRKNKERGIWTKTTI